MVGVPVEVPKLSMLAVVPLLSSVQLFDGDMSPNTRLPIVRAVSRWTVLSAVMLSVLKFAVASAGHSAASNGRFTRLQELLQLRIVPLKVEERSKRA